ncbi:MAG: hypothetical protein ACR2HV_04145, partial [Acidimicrobiales bacterium]
MLDLAAIDRPLDYLVPDHLSAHVRVGTVVRVPLQGRRVRGWVVQRTAGSETTKPLQPLGKVTGWGPGPDLVDLSHWAAWRWAGPRVTFLRAGSAPGAVPTLPAVPARVPATALPVADDLLAPLVTEAFAAGRGTERGGGPAVVRLPPAVDPFAFVSEAARRGDALVLA